MAKRNNVSAMTKFLEQEYKNTTIVSYKGQEMTYLEYKTLKAKEKREAKKHKKVSPTFIKALPNYTKELIKAVKVLKSLAAFYDNGYRQWGIICRDILNNPQIEGPYASFRILVKEINENLETISMLSNKNEKNVFQFVEKLSIKVDDIKVVLQKLCVGVNASRVCEFYHDKEVIAGAANGRRLGLEELMIRSMYSMSDLEKTKNELMSLYQEGMDSITYDEVGGKLHCNYNF